MRGCDLWGGALEGWYERRCDGEDIGYGVSRNG